jgi:hypothetical protein
VTIDENTLGSPMTTRRELRMAEGRKPRSRTGGFARTAATPRPGRAARVGRVGLGTKYLGVGAIILVSLRYAYGLSHLAMNWTAYPDPMLSVVAWAVLVAVSIGAVIAFRRAGDKLETWKFLVFLFGVAGAVAIDVVAVWPLGDIGTYATAATAAGMSLLLVVTLRLARQILGAALGLAVGLAAAMAVASDFEPTTLGVQISALAFAVIPPAVGVVVVRGFRRMVELELDRVMVASTVSAPRFAVGMLASEELARLDLAAEELLDSVASGSVPLPLDPRTASVASQLATELRLHLIEGRRETWLYHAVTESELLGKSVTVTDQGSLAGLLDPSQRDGLLQAVWLVISESAASAPSRTIQIGLGPIVPTSPGDKLMQVPITIRINGVARPRVDPAVWNAMHKIGAYTETPDSTGVTVVIDCRVERPRDVNVTQHHERGHASV